MKQKSLNIFKVPHGIKKGGVDIFIISEKFNYLDAIFGKVVPYFYFLFDYIYIFFAFVFC